MFKAFKILTFLLAVVFVFFVILTPIVMAQSEVQIGTQDTKLEARIESVLEEKKITVLEKEQLYQKLQLIITKGDSKDEKIIVENGQLPAANILKFKVGEKVLVTKTENMDGSSLYYITDYIRRKQLFWLFAIFALLTIVVGKIRGLTSLIGMGISFVVIFMLILPQILTGKDPIFISILGSFFIVPVIFYLSHGFNKKTTIAIAGTFLTLVVTGILANIFVEVTRLSGFSTEEAGFLQVAKEGEVNIKGLLLAGIIIGVLGVLDDVTVAQAAVVSQLKKANNTLKPFELYKRAMDVGQDHIASMVNTLILVYAGAAMPLLLLFVNNPHPFTEIINYEIVASEIVRTLVGSIGLILAVPITTYIAALVYKKA